MEILKTAIGYYHGQVVYHYELINSSGASIELIDYGATNTAINVPNAKGEIENIAVQAPSLHEIIAYRPYYGVTVGPVAGRLSNAKYTNPYTDEIVSLEANEKGKTHLHGGYHGLDTHLWQSEIISENSAEAAVSFKTVYPDGKAGYPGPIDVEVTHAFNEQNEWTITYQAKTERDTLFNPTNHVYFNLKSLPGAEIYDYQLTVNADKYAPLTAENVPTGELEDVQGTPFDLRRGRHLEEVLKSNHEQIQLVGGLDHAFFLSHDSQKPDAVIQDTETGRKILMTTDADAVVVYTHNSPFTLLDDYGEVFGKHIGLTLEAQHLPDAINHQGFGNISLRPQQTFRSTTVYQFLVDPNEEG